MAKPADLRKAMAGNTRGDIDRHGDPHYRPGRQGKSNVTGYFPPAVKRQLRILAAEQDTTIQALLGQALNDLFAKFGKPEIVPVEE